jgi:hypothetical protein
MYLKVSGVCAKEFRPITEIHSAKNLKKCKSRANKGFEYIYFINSTSKL